MTAEPAASLACHLAYHVAMKPSVVMLLAACGLPVPFSTTLKQHVQVLVPRVTLITLQIFITDNCIRKSDSA